MLTATLKPITNPSQSSKDEMTTWMQQVNNKVFNKKPLNAPNIATLSRQIYKEFFVEYATSTNGGYQGVWPEYTLLPKPTTNYKLNNINALTFSLSWILEVPGTVGFPGFPTGDSSWSVDFYVYFKLYDPTLGNFFNLSSIDLQSQWQVKFTVDYTYDGGSPNPFDLAITTPYREYNMFDTIDYRRIVSGQPEYDGVNDDKLTFNALNKLLSQANSLSFTFSANQTQYNALSSANKTHFLALFGSRFAYTGPPAIAQTTGALRSSLDMAWTYGGTFAEYTP